MDFIQELFQYKFLLNALFAILLAGISCGVIGTYIVTRRLVFLSGGITHTSFGGIGIAYYLQADPILGALVFSVLSALGIDMLSDRSKIREDSAIGILWSLGMAVGIIFIFLTPGYSPNLMSYLFGNILTVTHATIVANLVLDVVLVAVMLLMFRSILCVSFDRDFARTQNIRTKFVTRMMLVLAAVTIVLIIKLMGIMLLMSLLTIPPVIANMFVRQYVHIMLFSILIAVLAGISGLWISYATNFPSGASIIIVLGGLFILCKSVLSLMHRKKVRIGLKSA